ncbi:hypothetical protein [Planctomicrobium sp. SH664]|uniref:hypothetical protein n=1 Tax=Planctomicrobium sp. SH664 TaxID=3448125 RepID=UPI003F5B37F3
MALGKREESRQKEFWTPTASLSKGPGHVFDDQLNQALAQAGFNKILEDLCGPYCARTGRLSIPLGMSLCCWWGLRRDRLAAGHRLAM